MANDEHVAILNKGVEAWNAWRHENRNIPPDLCQANLIGANLEGANLEGADLSDANLSTANLGGANLSDANLYAVDLNRADLCFADLTGANLSGADLSAADLSAAQLLFTDLTSADLTGCHIHGISAWNLKLEGAKQRNLVITPQNEPEITVDNIEVAQFVYLLLHNEKIRDVIDTIGKKGVLLLGRFTDERKAVLDALREELRKRDYLPILFDFNVPATRDITETVSLLARMARFIIADLTDPSSIPKELEAIVPDLAVPVQPLLEGSSRPYAMFKDYWKYEWVLPVYRYEGLEPLLATLAEKVIAPAEGKVKALEERRRMIEAELTRPL
jgi:Pentapeptide repeats (8 copies)